MKYNINRNVNIVSQYEYIVRSISRIKTKFVRYDIINIPRSFPTEFVVVSSRRDPRVRLSRTVSCHEARGTVRLLINGRKSVGKKEEKGRSGDDLTEGEGAGIGGRIAGKIDNNTAHDAWEGGGGESRHQRVAKKDSNSQSTRGEMTVRAVTRTRGWIASVSRDYTFHTPTPPLYSLYLSPRHRDNPSSPNSTSEEFNSRLSSSWREYHHRGPLPPSSSSSKTRR